MPTHPIRARALQRTSLHSSTVNSYNTDPERSPARYSAYLYLTKHHTISQLIDNIHLVFFQVDKKSSRLPAISVKASYNSLLSKIVFLLMNY